MNNEFRKNIQHLLDSGDAKAALNVCVKWTNTEHDNSEAWLIRGKTEDTLYDSRSAIRSGLRAIAITPDNIDAWIHLKKLAICNKKYEEAENCCWQTIRLAPNNADFYSDFGFVLYKLRRFDEAEEAFHEAITMDSDNINSLSRLILVLFVQSKTKDALEHLSSLLKHHPEAAIKMCKIGQECLSTNEVDVAIQIFEGLISTNPTIDLPYAGLSQAYLITGRVADAQETLNKGLNLNPDLPGANDITKNIRLASRSFKLNI